MSHRAFHADSSSAPFFHSFFLGRARNGDGSHSHSKKPDRSNLQKFFAFRLFFLIAMATNLVELLPFFRPDYPHPQILFPQSPSPKPSRCAITKCRRPASNVAVTTQDA